MNDERFGIEFLGLSVSSGFRITSSLRQFSTAIRRKLTVLDTLLIVVGSLIVLFARTLALSFAETFYLHLEPIKFSIFVIGLVLSTLGIRKLLPETLDSILDSKVPSQNWPEQSSLSHNKFAVEQVKYVIELNKTKIAVEYSDLSNRAKTHCLHLLEMAEIVLEQATNLEELQIIDELIQTASKIKNALRRDSSFVVIYTIFIVILLGILASLTWDNWNETAFNKVIFGIPMGVLIWSAIGGLVSVLFRYTFQKQEFQEPTSKVLVIRPFLGMVLGTVTYFAFASGLLVLGGGESVSPVDSPPSRDLFFSVLAFLTGFSDRLAVFILGTVAGKIAVGWETSIPSELERDKKPDVSLIPLPTLLETPSEPVLDTTGHPQAIASDDKSSLPETSISSEPERDKKP